MRIINDPILGDLKIAEASDKLSDAYEADFIYTYRKQLIINPMIFPLIKEKYQSITNKQILKAVDVFVESMDRRYGKDNHPYILNK